MGTAKAEEHLLGGVLAGGGSRRYGKDKAFVEWEGLPLVEHALRNVSSLADETYILSKEPDRFASLPWTVIPDSLSTPTPLSGILSISPFVKKWLLIAACDILVHDQGFLQSLWDARRPGFAVIPRTEWGLQPLLALYPKELLLYWEDAYELGDFRLRRIAEGMPHIPLDITSTGGAPELTPFRNINRPEDLVFIKD